MNNILIHGIVNKFECSLFPAFKFYRRLCGDMLISAEDLFFAQKRNAPLDSAVCPHKNIHHFQSQRFYEEKSSIQLNGMHFSDYCQLFEDMFIVFMFLFKITLCLKLNQNPNRRESFELEISSLRVFSKTLFICSFWDSLIKLKRISNLTAQTCGGGLNLLRIGNCRVHIEIFWCYAEKIMKAI